MTTDTTLNTTHTSGHINVYILMSVIVFGAVVFMTVISAILYKPLKMCIRRFTGVTSLCVESEHNVHEVELDSLV